MQALDAEIDTAPIPAVPNHGARRGEAERRNPIGREESRNRIVAFIPVYNGMDCIGKAIHGLLAQSRRPDLIVIIANGCRDATAMVAREFTNARDSFGDPCVTVLELPRLPNKKSEALNEAWHRHGYDADIIVCCDDDTLLPPFAVEHWERELMVNPRLGGSSSQPIMTGTGFLARTQRSEFSKSAELSLRRGWCRVISGTGCAYRVAALKEVASDDGAPGPWTYLSVVEDYHLTYQLRSHGWLAEMSPTVYVYTGAMHSVKSLWAQRIKWQTGTVADLIRFGINRLNWREWGQQGFGLACICFWSLWLCLITTELAVYGLRLVTLSWLYFPIAFSVIELLHARKIHGRTPLDWFLAGSLIQIFGYTFLSMGWIIASWYKAVTDSQKDMWEAQYKLDGTVAADESMTEGIGHAMKGMAGVEARRRWLVGGILLVFAGAVLGLSAATGLAVYGVLPHFYISATRDLLLAITVGTMTMAVLELFPKIKIRRR